MSVYKLKREVNSIYNEIYRINESLSISEYKEFMRGFEYGIKEGYKIFLEADNIETGRKFKDRLVGGAKSFWSDTKKAAGDVVDKTKKAASDVVDAGKKAYSSGLETAGKLWGSIVDFGKSVIDGVKEKIGEIGKAIKNGYNSVKQSISDILNEVSVQIVKSYEQFKDKAGELKKSIIEIYNKSLLALEEGFYYSLGAIINAPEDLKKWYNNSKESLIKSFEESKKYSEGVYDDSIEKIVGFLKKGEETFVKTIQGAKEGSKLLAYFVIGAGIKGGESIISGIGKMTDAGEKTVSELKDAVRKKTSDYLNNLSSGLATLATKVGGKGSDKVEIKYKELVKDWKEKQKRDNKNTSPGEGTRKKLRREAERLVDEGYLYKTFESFIYNKYN